MLPSDRGVCTGALVGGKHTHVSCIMVRFTVAFRVNMEQNKLLVQTLNILESSTSGCLWLVAYNGGGGHHWHHLTH